MIESSREMETEMNDLVLSLFVLAFFGLLLASVPGPLRGLLADAWARLARVFATDRDVDVDPLLHGGAAGAGRIGTVAGRYRSHHRDFAGTK